MRHNGVLFAVLVASTGWLCFKASVQYDPLSVTVSTDRQLHPVRQQAGFADLPGGDTKAERARGEGNLNELLARIIAGLSAHPGKRWALAQMPPTVDTTCPEDTEASERCIDYLARINSIVGISSTNGAFAAKFHFV